MANKLVFINIKNYLLTSNKAQMAETNNFEEPLFPISVTAKLLDISVHTLRMYEREGLIIPFKKKTNHRLYSKADIERINCIRRAINEFKISIAGIKTIYSLIPCWQIVKCSDEDRKNCEAFSSHTNPCWSFNHKNNICENLTCRECTVYKNYSECKAIKDNIKSLSLRKESIGQIPSKGEGLLENPAFPEV